VLRVIIASLLSCSALFAQADIQVNDEMGIFSITTAAKKIVVLEFSFVDALANLDISPIGVADDGKANNVIGAIKDKIDPWASVGSRSTPNLEIIASLKPDMIIADIERHATIYKDLQQIAPTLILKSRGESYQDNLSAVLKIGKALDQEERMQQLITDHGKRMDEFAKSINSDKSFLFAVSSTRGVYMHSPKAYAGGVMARLGLASAIPKETEKAYISTTLERLVKANPDYLLVGEYGDVTMIDSFKKSPLWKMISTVKSDTYRETDALLWSKNRGMIAAEIMAKELQSFVN
jgi:iron complex transport system substrate-binding protein